MSRFFGVVSLLAALAVGGYVLRQADTTSHCVESIRAPASHLTGPGGAPGSGPC